MKCIILQSEDGTLRRAFTVLLDGYSPELDKRSNQNITVTGKSSIQSGPALKGWRYIIKVKNDNSDEPNITHSAGTIITATNTNFGTLANLKAFYALGVGYNKLAMLDVDGTEYEVILRGSVSERALTNDVTTYGIFHVKIDITKVEAA